MPPTLLSSICQATSLSTNKDDFTVGSSGAAVAAQFYHVSGQGVTVAVLDSGIRDTAGHDLLNPATGASRVLAAVSFVPSDLTTDDQCGHGTHIGGIIAGNGTDSTGPSDYHTYMGIAPQANLVNVRVLDAQGSSLTSSILQGMQWVYDNRAACHIRVVSLSLGHPVGESYASDPLCQAAEALYRAGIVVVCAAGNAGCQQNTLSPLLANEGFGTNYGFIESPGNDPYVIMVGAMKSPDGVRGDDRIATYSSRGPSFGARILKPDLVAPGNKIISLRCSGSSLDTQYGATNQVLTSHYVVHGQGLSPYFTLSGTSMATPVVAGAAALLQADPTLSPDTVKARLMLTASPWGDLTTGQPDPCPYGAGYLNIAAAISCNAVAPGPAVSPTLSVDASGIVSVSSAGTIWGSNINRGSNINWGSSSVLSDALSMTAGD